MRQLECQGPGFHLTSAAGRVTLGLSSRCLHMRDGQCLSLSLCQLGFLGDGVCLLPEAARWTGVPCNTPPGPRLPLSIASHLGGSGSSRPGAWVRSIPFPGPGRFGSPCSMGAPPGGDGRRGRIIQGLAGEGRDTREGAAQTPLPYPSLPPPTCMAPPSPVGPGTPPGERRGLV